jgi:tRNA(Ile)-lysidine synthase
VSCFNGGTLTTLPCIGGISGLAMAKVEALSPVVAALREFFTAHVGRTLLAVSGGADSLALLLAAATVARERVGVASIDHGLRLASSDEVEAVRRLATTLGVPFHTAALRLRPGPGMEARAREARYAALEALRVAGGYSWLATAHTRDDQAETLLMRLARGSALRGAGAIRARSGHVLRPLLAVGRADIEAYVLAQGLSPVRDPSNLDETLLRVRVRTGVLPALVAAAGEASVKNLAAFAARAAEDEALLAEQAAWGLGRARLAEGGLDAVAMRGLVGPLRRRALVVWLAEAGLPASAALVARVEAALMRGGRCGLPGRRELRSEGGVVRLLRPIAIPEAVTLEPGAWVPFGAFRLRLDSGTVAEPAFGLGDATGPYRVRGRRPGERVEAGAGRRRSVQDVLVDARIPAEQRAAWPLLVDALDRVLWVVSLWPATRTHVQGTVVRAEATSAIPHGGL